MITTTFAPAGRFARSCCGFTGPREVAAILFSTEAAAIHAAYLDSLGLWLDEAVDRYLATLTPPQPEPQMGEVWEVTLDDGSKARALAESRGEVGIRCASTWAWFPDELPDRRLLITADGEWVGGES